MRKPYDKEEQKRLQDKFDAERREYLKALRRILGTRDGVILFKELFIFTSLFTTTFTGDSKIYLREGIKHVGYKLLEDIAELNDPQLISKVVEKIMLKEG